MKLSPGRYSFPLLLFVTVGLAVVFPEPVHEGGSLSSNWLTRLSVALVFFLQGMSLPTQSLAAGYRPLRLHGLVLFWNFIGFPVVTLLLLYPLAGVLPGELLIGFGMLALLPTTIASATAFTAMSAGNTANSIVSSVLSNLLAVFVVPAVSVVYFSLEFSVDIPFGKVLFGLICMLLIPLLLGQIAQKIFKLNIGSVAKFARRTSAGIILFIVYLAFAKSMNAEMFVSLSVGWLVITVFLVVFLILVTSLLVWISTKWVKLAAPQRSAAFYCASQKSLAAGLPLISSVLLAMPEMEDTAVILIPLLCFHPLQMLLAGMISSKLMQQPVAQSDF